MVLKNIHIWKTETRFLSLLSLHTNINSTWIRDLHIRPETLKLIEDTIEETQEDIGIDDDFLNRIPIA
jgi:hypothetical protein